MHSADEKGLRDEFKVSTALPYSILTVPRARLIHQPLLTTPLSSLRTLLTALRFLMNPAPTAGPNVDFPDIILANGPATAAIFILAAIILRFFNIRRMSFARKVKDGVC